MIPKAPPAMMCLRVHAGLAGDEGHQGNMATLPRNGDHVVQEEGGDGTLHSMRYTSSYCWAPSELLQGWWGCLCSRCRETRALDVSLKDSWLISYHWILQIMLPELQKGRCKEKGCAIRALISNIRALFFPAQWPAHVKASVLQDIGVKIRHNFSCT